MGCALADLVQVEPSGPFQEGPLAEVDRVLS